MNNPALSETVSLILHFRHHAHTAACLDSLLADGVVRVVLVDNSEDGGASLQRLRPHLDALRARGMEPCIDEPGRNLGFSAGVNRGLEVIARHFGAVPVLLINNDARLTPGSHARLRHALSQGNDIAVAEMRTPGAATVRIMFYHPPTGLLMRSPLSGSYAAYSGCCLLIGARLAQPPLFDEDFFFYGDDIHLGWKLLRTAAKVHVTEGASVEHEVSTGSRNGSLFYEYHMARAHWILAGKLANNPAQHGLFLLGRALTLPARALLRAARQRSGRPLQGLALATWDVMQGRCRPLTPPASAPDGLAAAADPVPPSSPR